MSEVPLFLAHKKPPPPPETTTGPKAWSYCRVLGVVGFLWARYFCNPRPEIHVPLLSDCSTYETAKALTLGHKS